jgi:hypothetical protein
MMTFVVTRFDRLDLGAYRLPEPECADCAQSLFPSIAMSKVDTPVQRLSWN